MTGKHALIIGNTEYQDKKLPPLRTPIEDVNLLAQALHQPEIGNFDEVVPLINANESSVRVAIGNFFSDKQPDDLLLFYFSGHGVIFENTNELYLAVKDSKYDRIAYTGIPSSLIRTLMDACESDQQILILDCCHSGAFFSDAKGVEDNPMRQLQGSGRFILTASSAAQNAYQGENTSIFTHHLVNGLVTGEADLDGDGQVSLAEWYLYAEKKVNAETRKQKPLMTVFRQQGNLYVARNPHPPFLPEELRQKVNDPTDSVRMEAVVTLSDLLQSPEYPIRQAAREMLARLSVDRIRAVANAATLVINSNPEKPPVTSTTSGGAPPETIPALKSPPGPIQPDPSKMAPPQSPPSQPEPPQPARSAVPPTPSPQPTAPQPSQNIPDPNLALRWVQEEIDRIVRDLQDPNANIIFLRERMKNWRAYALVQFRERFGAAAALRLNAIVQQEKIRLEHDRLVDVAQRCRACVYSILFQGRI